MSLHFGKTIPMLCQWRGFNEITLGLAKQVEKKENIWMVLEHFDTVCFSFTRLMSHLAEPQFVVVSELMAVSVSYEWFIENIQSFRFVCCLYRNMFLCRITKAIADMINHMPTCQRFLFIEQTLVSMLQFAYRMFAIYQTTACIESE